LVPCPKGRDKSKRSKGSKGLNGNGSKRQGPKGQRRIKIRLCPKAQAAGKEEQRQKKVAIIFPLVLS